MSAAACPQAILTAFSQLTWGNTVTQPELDRPPRSTNLAVWIILGAALTFASLLVLGIGAFGLWAYLDSNHAGTREPEVNDKEVLLKQVPGEGAPVKYGNTAVFDACSIVTMEKLTAFGVQLSDKFAIGHQRLDSDVPVAAAIEQSSNPVSQCHYTPANENHLFVKVHQTPFNSAAELTRMQERGTRAGSAPQTVDGLTVTRWTDEQRKTRRINMWKPDLLVDISFEEKSAAPFGTLSADAFAVELEKMVREGVAKGATAPMRHVYSAPMDKVKDACEIASKEAFKRAYPAAPGEASYVDASYHLQAEFTDFSLKPSVKARMGMTRCSRHNLVPDGVVNKQQYRELDVDLRVWNDKRPADDHNSTMCGPGGVYGDAVAITPPVGTGKTCLGDLSTDWTLDFQLDAVNLSINGAVADNPTSAERRGEFLPAAEEIARAGIFR